MLIFRASIKNDEWENTLQNENRIDLNKLLAKAFFELSAYEPDQLGISDRPEIVFSGKSNVGKSSMINRIVSRKGLARVSSAPGKTASVNFYDCGVFRLVDLPGYGYAKVSKQEKSHWSGLVNGYLGGKRAVALVIQLIDARHAPAEGDLQMLDYLARSGLPYLVAMTKSDKLKNTQLAVRREEMRADPQLGASRTIFTSSETGMGIEELKAEIANACSGSVAQDEAED